MAHLPPGHPDHSDVGLTSCPTTGQPTDPDTGQPLVTLATLLAEQWLDFMAATWLEPLTDAQLQGADLFRLWLDRHWTGRRVVEVPMT